MLETEEHGDIRELRLARPPVNAINLELVQALRAELARAVADERHGVILSGRPGIFSAGLDLKDLLALSRPQLKTFWKAFFNLLQDLANLPCPAVAAITGHSPAGGAVLALFCDRRIAAHGKYVMGLNEVQVGLVVPWPIQRAFTRLLGARQAERLLVAGALLSPDDALAVGFLDEVADTEAVVPQSVQWLQQINALPRNAMLQTRKLLRAEYAQPFAEVGEGDYEQMLDGWFSDATQRSLRAVLERLEKKKS